MTLEEAINLYNNPSLENLEGEEWRTIKEYPNYEVSNLGRIKKKDYIHFHKDGRVFNNKTKIKQQTVKDGYMEVRLFNENKLGHNEGRLERTHRLIAIAFIPNPENKPYIDHINTIRHDNSIANLRWCTLTENLNNPITISKNKESARKRVENPKERERLSEISRTNFSNSLFRERFKQRMNDDDVKKKMRRTSCCKKVQVFKNNQLIGEWFSSCECARQTGISQAQISKWCRSNKPNKKGEIWIYAL